MNQMLRDGQIFNVPELQWRRVLSDWFAAQARVRRCWMMVAQRP
jgi:hypothetical protein